MGLYIISKTEIFIRYLYFVTGKFEESLRLKQLRMISYLRNMFEVTVLFIANLLATVYSSVVVANIYEDDVCSDEAIPALYAGTYGVTLLFALKLTEYNINLALLIPIVAPIANVVVAKLAIRADYKRNTKEVL